MVGNKFGKWLVISIAEHPKGRKGRHFLCRCECGNERILPSNHLMHGKSTQCVDCFRNRKDRYAIGHKIYAWTILEERKNHWQEMSYLCRCDCGNEKIVRARDLQRGKSTKCTSCHISIKNTTHNHSKSPTYVTWASMKTRCNNPKDRNYEWYGARGIKICDEWHNFENFLRDMGARPEEMTLDRIDPDGNYEKSNCRWVTQQENHENRRCSTKYKGQYVTIRKDKLCENCLPKSNEEK